MGPETTTKPRGLAQRLAALGIPRQIAFLFAIITAIVAFVGLLVGVNDAYVRFVKLMAVIMSVEIIIVFALELAGMIRRAWRRRLKFLVTVLSGHIVLFTLAGSLVREGSGELALLILGAIILIANALDRTEPADGGRP